MQLRIRPRLRAKERGATIVLVSLSMVALLGMAAVSVDYAVASDEKGSAQSAADAAALAVAADCAVNKSTCNSTTATWYAQQNAGASASVQTYKDGVAKSPAYADGKVTVRVSKDVSHTFAKVLGDNASTVRGQATATWDTVPLRAANLIPIGLSYCDWAANQATSESSPGAEKTYLWSKFDTTETSCAGTSVTAPTVYGQRGSASGYTSVGRAMYFTASLFPGFNTNCNFSPDLWDVYRDILDDWSLLTLDSCMTSKFSGITSGSIIMMPIYAREKKSILWNLISYSSRLIIIGFAPFKISNFVTYPALYFGSQPSSGSLGTASTCSFGFSLGLPGLIAVNFGGRCAGLKGRFVRSSDAALFANFTDFGTTYNNTDSGLSGTAPQLGSARVKLVQ